tara:strand:+ start:819 stop:1934 length:1116 start_codon:yes stop_codon:yes gene_type:complete
VGLIIKMIEKTPETTDPDVNDSEAIVSEKVHAEKPAAKKKYSILRITLMSVIVAALTGLAYFTWLQQITLQTIFSSETQLVQLTEDINRRLQVIDQNIVDINDRNASNGLLLNQQNSRIDNLNDELVSLRLGVSSGQNSGVWQLVEAVSLLRLGQQYLQLNQDVAVALSLYQSCRSILNQIDDPAVVRIRNMLAADIQILGRQQGVDIQSLFMRLSETEQQLAMVSLRNVREPSMAFEEREAGSEEQGFIARIGNQLSKYFTVRRLDAPEQMPLDDEQLTFLRQNMQLQLEQAKLALLQRRPGIYQDSISNVLMLAQQNIPEQDQLKTTILRDLRDLQSASIALNLPRLSDSLGELETLLGNINSDTDAGI